MPARNCYPLVNRAEPSLLEDMAKTIKPGTNQRKVYIIPELAELRYPTVGEVASALSLDWVAGPEQLTVTCPRSKRSR